MILSDSMPGIFKDPHPFTARKLDTIYPGYKTSFREHFYLLSILFYSLKNQKFKFQNNKNYCYDNAKSYDDAKSYVIIQSKIF